MLDFKKLGKRILILGCPGSGKTYFAWKLSEALNIPCYHMDDIFWEENWVPAEEKKFLKDLNEIMKKETWILDGNHKRYLDLRLRYADAVIFIEAPASVCLYRVIKRAIKLFFFPSLKNSLPQKIVEGLRKGYTKVFYNFLEFLYFVLTYQKKDKIETLQKVKERPFVSFIKLDFHEIN